MRVLVTGGAGFIGSHLVERLLSGGHSVIVVDDLSTGSFANIKQLSCSKSLEIIRHDVVYPFQRPVDRIYNLACPASPLHYQQYPTKTVLTSVIGAVNALALATETGARILQASTSEVYGDPHQHPQKESYRGNVNPIGLRSCYDEGKRVAETLMFDFHRQYGVDIRVARIFNTYGPRMQPDDGRMVSTFVVQALQGKPLTVFGDGLQTRCLCYVDDLVEGLIRLMECDGFTGPVNLGNPDERSVRDIAELIIRLADSQSEMIYQSLPEDDPKRRRPDIGLAQTTLNWQPRVTLEEGLSAIIEHFRGLVRNAS